MFDSPKKYILTRARSLPIDQCYITENWQEVGIANIVVARRHTNGHLTFSVYLVDTYCLGVKDTAYYFNVVRDELDEVLETSQSFGEVLKPCDYAVAHNVIYGAIEFAEEYGFKPHKDFAVTKFILEEDDDRVELIEYEFGMNEKPCVIVDAEHPQKTVIAQLERTAGPGNFEVINVDELSDDDEFDEFDQEDDMDDEFDFHNWTEQDWQDYEEGKKPVPEDYAPLMIDFLYDIATAKENTPDSMELAEEFLDEFTVVDEPINLGSEVSDEERKDMEDIVNSVEHKAKDDASKYISLFRDRVRKYPRNPFYYDLLANTYFYSGNRQAALETIREMMQRFPDNYLPRLYACTFHVLMKNFDEIPVVLDNAIDLEHLPGIRRFRVLEMMLYCAVLCQYHLHKDDLTLADVYYHALKMLHRKYDTGPFDDFMEQTLLQVVSMKSEYLMNMKPENSSTEA